MSKIIYKEESFKIIGVCMAIHRELGMGFKEWVYKEAMELEFKEREIPYLKEKLFKSIRIKAWDDPEFWRKIIQIREVRFITIRVIR